MRKRLAAMLAAPVMLGAVLAGCSAPEKIKDAGPAVDAFHRQLDAGAFQAIWKDGDDMLRQNAGEAQFEQLLSAVHKKLGKVVKSERAGWNVNYGTGGTIVTVTMNTRFERGSGVETLTFHAQGDRLDLAGYAISSNDMMMK
jgi:hypothetical protein